MGMHSVMTCPSCGVQVRATTHEVYRDSVLVRETYIADHRQENLPGMWKCGASLLVINAEPIEPGEMSN